MIVLIDNYDSFTYNLYHYVGELGVDVVVHRNDAITVSDVMALSPQGIILSPGPCDPDKAGICLDLVECAAGIIPIFGVCLGFQSIGQVFGAKIVRAAKPMHGKVSSISHNGKSVFHGLPTPLQATRYHSLGIDPDTVPECLEVTAHSDDGAIQGICHRELNVHGVQFHPESIETEHGHQMLQNFLNFPDKRQAA